MQTSENVAIACDSVINDYAVYLQPQNHHNTASHPICELKYGVARCVSQMGDRSGTLGVVVLLFMAVCPTSDRAGEGVNWPDE